MSVDDTSIYTEANLQIVISIQQIILIAIKIYIFMYRPMNNYL